MKILYKQDDIDPQKINLLLADLIGYKLQRDLETTKKLRALSGDSKTLSSIVNIARKSKSATGMTIDTVLTGIETALSMEIFSFKFNGVDIFKLAQEQMSKTKGVELEVFMNPMYFASEVAMKGAVMPGFRKKSVEESYINERINKAEKAWAFHFEKDIKEYIDMGKCVKEVLEETK